MFHIQDIPLVTAPAMFAQLSRRDVVLLDSKTGQINTEQEEALCAFVERGGGLLCIGDAAEAYHEYELLGEVLGNIHGFCTPRCEVIARVATNDHYITRRVDPTFAVIEGIYLLDVIPHDAQVLWRTSWHYTSPALAYTRNHGRGRVFCTTLGSAPETQTNPVFQQMVGRAASYVAGMDVQETPARVAMIGYGVIGFEHGTAISTVPGLEYSLVCDRNEERLAVARQAFPGVHTCTNLQQVLKRGTIGTLFHIETFIGGYAHPCDYWHSHEPISGGVFYDWGSHYLDWILQLVPDTVVSVRGVEHKRVWHDVTNADHSSVYLRFASGKEAEFMHSDIAAAMKPKWYILGTRGAIVGHWRRETVKTRRWSGDLIEEHLAPSEALPELYVYTREMSGAIHEQHLMLPEPPLYAFHRNLANHLHCGEPLAVPPEQSRRNIAVMEAAKHSAEYGGETITLEC